MIPGAPLLVPELVGSPGDVDADRLRAAVLAAGRWLGERASTWRVVSETSPTWLDGAGTFAAFGSDVVVTAGPGGPIPAPSGAGPDPDLPLPLLVAAWMRGTSAPSARIVEDLEVEGVVFVLDGPNTLSARAPGGHRPEDQAIFDAQVAAVCHGAPSDQLDGAWRAAAEAFAGAPVNVLYRDAPFGVGYLVATGGVSGATGSAV